MTTEGLITTMVGTYLSMLAGRVHPEHAIVEIGSYKGMSTTYLGKGAREGKGAHVYAIDPWDLPGNETGRFKFADPATREAFDQRIADEDLEDQVTAIQSFSLDAAASWSGPLIELLFIDGDHSENAVIDDWGAWRMWLAPDAIVVFDDYVSETGRSPGVERAIKRIGEPYEVVADRLAVIRR